MSITEKPELFADAAVGSKSTVDGVISFPEHKTAKAKNVA